tara:strand:+ start:526 stop:1620 length:1095 start_codon:yes stop_codon:yes gene_type:complete
MKICLIGKNLVNLVISRAFINSGINVVLYKNNLEVKHKISKSRTVGLSQNSINFLEEQGIKIKKIGHKINKINLQKNEEEKNFLEFNANKTDRCFTMVKNDTLFNKVCGSLKKEKLYSEKSIGVEKNYEKILTKFKNSIIINSESNNFIKKKYFPKSIKKDYHSKAFTSIITHQNIKNEQATQVFTNFGPLAFLPISRKQTSIVFSVYNNAELDENKIKELIKRYNKNYIIKSFQKIESFPIRFSVARKYVYKNILLFGDNIHRVHPLAGQGFNMTIRDIITLNSLIKKNISLGLDLLPCLKAFEKKRGHSNLLFSHGIDFIHEFFKLDNKIGSSYTKKLFNIFNSSLLFKKLSQQVANSGRLF